MVDPRLNSVHLEAPRRQDFRRAREALFQAHGGQTLCAEQGVDEPADCPSNTLIQKDGRQDLSLRLQFWLADDQYIYPLKVGLNTVGRSSDNNVVVADCCISRRHCAILMHTRRGCELHDTASKNGTFLNGAKVDRPTALKSGDAIRICDRQFVFLTAGDPRPVPVSPDLTL